MSAVAVQEEIKVTIYEHLPPAKFTHTFTQRHRTAYTEKKKIRTPLRAKSRIGQCKHDNRQQRTRQGEPSREQVKRYRTFRTGIPHLKHLKN